jgi:hypothetical protein
VKPSRIEGGASPAPTTENPPAFGGGRTRLFFFGGMIVNHAQSFQSRSRHSHRFSTERERDRYIWWCLLLTPQVTRRTMRASSLPDRDFPVKCGCASRRALAAGGKYRCSICRVSRFSASTRCVTCAATGCVPTRLARSAKTAGARAAAICCGRCRRPSDQDFVCDLVPSRPARRCGLGPASGKSPSKPAPRAERHVAPFFYRSNFCAQAPINGRSQPETDGRCVCMASALQPTSINTTN